MSIPADFAADLQRNQTNLPNDILARLILFYQKSLDVPENDIVVDSFYYSPLIDIHDTSILLAGPTISDEDIGNHIASKAYTKIIPETVHSDPLVYDFSNSLGLTFNQPDQAFGTRFNGAVVGDDSSYILIDDHPSLDIEDEFIIPLWVYPITGGGTSRLLHKGNATYFVSLDGGNDITFKVRIGGVDIELTSSLLPDTWHHIVATVQSGIQSLYIDGILVESATQTGSINTNNASLGIAASSNGSGVLMEGEGLSWVSLIHGFADQAWVDNDFIGIRDVSQFDELVCFPFMQALNPQPPMTSGIFVSHP